MGPGGKTQALPFVYPPVALPLLRPLLALDYRATYFAFFAIKMAAVAALVALWRRRLFPDDLSGAVLFLLCAVGFGQTVKMDVRAGNISVFEQLLIWGAMLAFLRRRPWVFAALVAAAALVKLTAAGLLLMLIVDRGRRAMAALLAGLAALAVVHGLTALVRPGLFAGFLRNAAALDDRGRVNPSTLALVRDGLDRIPAAGAPPHLDGFLYGLFVIVVLAALIWASRRHDFRSDRAPAVFACLLAYALCLPRLKDYSYILLIPSAVFVVVAVLRGTAARLLALGLLCTHFFAYQSWVAALVLFSAYLARLRTSRLPPAPAESPGPA